MRACLFGAAAYHGEGARFLTDALVIAADAGFRHTEALGLVPDLVVGDFDSMKTIPKHETLIRHPVMKDDTDMALAAEEALLRGCDELFLFGAMGGRPDHTLANLSLLLSLARRGCAAYLWGKDGVFTVMTPKESLRFDAACQGTVSVFAAGDRAEGVTLESLLYPLTDHTLYADRALGVSNAFIGQTANVSVKKGELLLFWEKEQNPLPQRIPILK